MFKRKVKNNDIKELIQLRDSLRQKYKENYSCNVKVGDYTYGDFFVREWDNKTKLVIGKFCSIAEGVMFLLGGEHRSDFISTYPFNVLLKTFSYIKGHPKSKGNIIIGNDVWIGSHAKILSGVKIGNGAIIGANSLVTNDIPDYAIVGGNPAKIIRFRFNEKTISLLNDIKWWDFDEEKLLEYIPLIQSDNIDKFIKSIHVKNR